MRYLIALGSNRPGRHGRPEAELRAALHALDGLIAVSPILHTPALGPSIRRFANAAALIETNDGPPELLRRLKSIERDFGRRRGQRWGARVIDLDVILWSEGVWSGPGLTIPHPEFRKRAFVLDPLLRIAPDWRDPLTGLSLRQLRARLAARKRASRGRGGRADR